MNIINWKIAGRLATIVDLLAGVFFVIQGIQWLLKRRGSVIAIIRLVVQGVAFIFIVSLPMLFFMSLSFFVEAGNVTVAYILSSFLWGIITFVIPVAIPAATSSTQSQAENRALIVGLVIFVPMSIATVILALIPEVTLFMRVMIGITAVISSLFCGHYEAKFAWFIKQRLVLLNWFSVAEIELKTEH